MVKVSKTKISELGLIDYFSKNLRSKSPSVVRGIGDDAAVIKISKDKYLLSTSDMLIEGRHFKKTDNLYDIGSKAIACSLSDIAAMGGEPKFALISVGLPKRYKLKDVKELFSGIKKTAGRFSIDIIGGDTNQSDKLVLDVAMMGIVKPKNITLREGAKVGDYIFVTGALGGSIYGQHLRFLPRVKESLYLTNRFKLNSMIDISDGLVLDLWRILKSSRVGAVIFESLIPKSKDAKSLEEVLYMGEDFELLFTVSKKDAEKILDKIRKKEIRFPLSFIGKIINKKQQLWLVDKNIRLKRLKPQGYLHF